ncbi:MAG: tetratricopeptide repeat protein, partial [Planctomycetota bacterium]
RLIADFNDHPDLAEELFYVAKEYYAKAIQMKHKGLDTEARDHFTKAITLWKRIIQELSASAEHTPRTYYYLAHSYRHLDEYENASHYYQKIIDDWPDYYEAHRAQFLIGNCYESLRDAGIIPESEANIKIEDAYRAVVENYPDSTSVREASLKLGWLNFKRGLWLEAAEYFELSLQQSPENQRPVHILYPLGRAYEEIGQLDKAIQVYEEFINTAPSFEPHIDEVKARIEKLRGI